jgi:uncharacterized membrane protein YqjE
MRQNAAAASPEQERGASQPAAPVGVLEASRRLAAALVAAGRTRIELAAVELEEARLHLARLWIRAALTLCLLFTGAWLALGWWLLVSDPTDRIWITGSLALVFIAAGLMLAWDWRRQARSMRPWLASSLAELARDEEALRGRPAAHDGEKR